MVISSVLLTACLSAAFGAESRFAQTHNRGQYVHWIHLYDAGNRKIDPADENAPPYSPLRTCGRCHDYEAIAKGHHFNAFGGATGGGRPGEPWIWVDTRTGTQVPLSYRGWEGTYSPNALGISARDFVLKFGRHFPGGGPGVPPEPAEEKPAPAAAAAEEPASEDAAGEEAPSEESTPAAEEEPPTKELTPQEEKAAKEQAGWKLSGALDIDCMMCHGNDGAYSPEAWWEQIENENFAWAATAALGLGSVDGEVSDLPDDFDPTTAEPDSRDRLPKTTYGSLRIKGDNKVFLDIIRRPGDSACYYCHSNRPVGEGAAPEWTHDEDVHLKAGMSCADCHRNDLAHHTVRGYDGEAHPTGRPVHTLSCQGCHMGDSEEGGRLGAPKPLHKGLPPLHFDKLSCTACHSGPPAAEEAISVQTALAHGLGLPGHYTAEDPPGIAAPVFLRRGEVLTPHRMTWPAFWGQMKDDKITPLNPDDVQDALRRTLRVRRGATFTETVLKVKLSSEDKVEALGEERAKTPDDELTEEEKAKLADLERTKGLQQWQEKLADALKALKETIDEAAQPVYVSGGRAYRLTDDGKAEAFEHDAAAPYAWPLGHDVRPARQSLGAKGCYACHAAGTPIFEGLVTAAGPAPDEDPVTYAMHELAGYDKTKLDAWSQSFRGRTAFKWFGFVAMGVVGLVVLSFMVRGVNGVVDRLARRK